MQIFSGTTLNNYHPSIHPVWQDQQRQYHWIEKERQKPWREWSTNPGAEQERATMRTIGAQNKRMGRTTLGCLNDFRGGQHAGFLMNLGHVFTKDMWPNAGWGMNLNPTDKIVLTFPMDLKLLHFLNVLYSIIKMKISRWKESRDPFQCSSHNYWFTFWPVFGKKLKMFFSVSAIVVVVTEAPLLFNLLCRQVLVGVVLFTGQNESLPQTHARLSSKTDWSRRKRRRFGELLVQQKKKRDVPFFSSSSSLSWLVILSSTLLA